VRLLVDQELAGSTAEKLRALGHDAVNAREIGMDRSADLLLIEYAIAHDRVIATLDSDYPQLVATKGLSAPSIIFMRVKSPSSKTASELIDKICSLSGERLLAGVSCTLKSFRLRSIPITKA
jgi:predicted nuclease of predicted toxin-antitoxin system